MFYICNLFLIKNVSKSFKNVQFLQHIFSPAGLDEQGLARSLQRERERERERERDAQA